MARRHALVTPRAAGRGLRPDHKAWVWLLLTPAGLLVSIAVSMVVYGLLDEDWSSPELASWGENALVALVAFVPLAAGPALAAWTVRDPRDRRSSAGRAVVPVSGVLVAALFVHTAWTIVAFDSAA